MANKYYIPQGPSVGERVGDIALRYMNIKQAGELGREQNRIAAERTPIMERQVAVEERKEPMSTKNFGNNEFSLLTGEISRHDPKGAFKVLNQTLEMMAQNPNVNLGYVHDHFASNWDKYQPALAEAAYKIANDEKELPYIREHYSKIAKGIENDKTGELVGKLMPTVARERQMEDMGLMAQMAKAKGEAGPKVVPPGGALVGTGGNELYKAPTAPKEFAPHYPTPTTEGYVTIGLDGIPRPVMSPSTGKPLMPPIADPNLAGAKKAATEEAERVANLKKVLPKSRESLASLERQWDIVDKTIDKALNQISPFTAGVGAWTAIIPASPAKNLSENLKTIQANIGFDKLQDMRANSPTGGALGQVSDLENRLLQAVQGSLAQNQTPGQLIENLNTVKATLQQLKTQKRFAFDYDFREVRPQEQPQSQGQGLPQGLSEEDLNFNMQKYGKSREEVIQQYKRVKGVQ